MFAKASGGTEVIPLLERSSVPPCVGQEPDRTSGAPAWSPLKLQPPNPTVQGKAEALLDAARSTNKICMFCHPGTMAPFFHSLFFFSFFFAGEFWKDGNGILPQDESSSQQKEEYFEKNQFCFLLGLVT
jgi:hypothetical protein